MAGPEHRRTAATRRERAGSGRRGQSFLPSEVDPTVFDEAFLRQLERLLLLMRSPVRGGLKGGRRSVKRGQSVEFADYRDYTLGDDLRQLDWNVYARLEQLFVKLFVEEEDVTVTILIDASASMATGQPAKLLFAKRAAAALGYIGLASEDRGRGERAGRPDRPGGGRRCAGPAVSSGCSPTCRRSSRADGPTDLVAAARHAAAQLHGRGVVILISDLLDPAADRVIRELAATGSELIVLHVLSPDELDPPLEGDLRLVDIETGERDRRHRRPRDDRCVPGPPGCLEGGVRRPRRAAPARRYVDLSSDANLADLMFAELRRRRVLG